jgi:predicted nucleotidyltransferase component of viral defense system
MYLKGGTSLNLAYGLDRFSEDLDYNSNKKLNIESIFKDAIDYINIQKPGSI